MFRWGKSEIKLRVIWLFVEPLVSGFYFLSTARHTLISHLGVEFNTPTWKQEGYIN